MSGTIALSIPGLFLTCVKYFELIQLGRDFKDDFASHALRLRAIELRLSRWGKAAGITDVTSSNVVQALAGYGQLEVQFAHNALEQIEKLFKNTSETSESMARIYRSSAEPQAVERLQLLDEEEQLELDHEECSRTVKAILKVRIGYSKTLHFSKDLKGRAKWALFRKSQLDAMITTISSHIADLEKLFPAQATTLAQMEATNADTPVLAQLLTLATDLDPILASALKAQKKSRGHTFENVRSEGSSNNHLGNTYHRSPGTPGPSHDYQDMTFTGNSTNHAGDTYE